MSRQPKIRWRKSDEQELKRVVKNFNAKLNRIEKKNPDYTFHKVIASGEDFQIDGFNSNNSMTINRSRISGIMEINDTIMSELNLNLVEGILPINTNEICISQNMYQLIFVPYSK